LQIGTDIINALKSFPGILTSIILNDRKPPKQGFLVIIAIFGCGAHFSVNCAEMAGDNQRQLAYKIFIINDAHGQAPVCGTSVMMMMMTSTVWYQFRL